MTNAFPSLWTSPHLGPARWALTSSGVAPSSKTQTSTLPDSSVSRSLNTALPPGPILSEPRLPSRFLDVSMLTSPVTVQPARVFWLSNAHFPASSAAGGAAQGCFRSASSALGIGRETLGWRFGGKA